MSIERKQTRMTLSVEKIRFSYDSKPVLADISLTFKEGLFYSILGPNGCGKTTLMDILTAHLPPDAGTLLLDGRSPGTMTKQAIARKIALVSQNHAINFPFTVKEVVMMGRHPYIPRFASPSREDVDRVEAVMEKTDILDLKDRSVTELSGGEQQRCVFARALCQDTPFLLLDEAFSNMDINHTLGLLKIIRREVREKKRTIVSVFHDINLASVWSDRLVFMKNGRIAAAGKTDEVMTEQTIHELFEVQARISYNDYVEAKQVFFKN